MVFRHHHRKDRDQRREHDRLVDRARRGERASVVTPNDELLRPSLAPDSLSMRARRLMLEAEDRRQFHPEAQLRPAKLLDGRPSRGLRVAPAVIKKKPVYTKALVEKIGRKAQRARSLRMLEDVPSRVMFESPLDTLICVRRRMRREVLHALQLTGKGSGMRQRFREKNRNWYSDVEC